MIIRKLAQCVKAGEASGGGQRGRSRFGSLAILIHPHSERFVALKARIANEPGLKGTRQQYGDNQRLVSVGPFLSVGNSLCCQASNFTFKELSTKTTAPRGDRVAAHRVFVNGRKTKAGNGGDSSGKQISNRSKWQVSQCLSASDTLSAGPRVQKLRGSGKICGFQCNGQAVAGTCPHESAIIDGHNSSFLCR